ncbi:MAG: RNA polymerase factor sigma-54 [Spirochaetaceae bacterium]|jgi:RNA polymerase sigma-54 factor|nr:RNA polymerase factor sigma-54 [Spirochaetaceae bacterium]
MAQTASASLSLELKQTQKMSLEQTRSLEILQMPLIELRGRITQELDENPALEALDEKSDISLDALEKPANETAEYFETTSDSGYTSTVYSGFSGDNAPFIEGAPARAETLREGLLWQLRLTALPEPVRAAGEALIQNLNTDGFNIVPLDELAASPIMPAGTTSEILAAAVDAVRRLDPAGCCVDNYKQSLEAQAFIRYPEDAAEITALLAYLEELEKGKFAYVSKKLNIDEAEITELWTLVKTLSPFPARTIDYSGEDEARYVIPDIQVVNKDGEQTILFNDEQIPVLGLSPFFVEHKFAKGEERNFVREKIRDARTFIDSIHRRERTLLRVTRAIVNFQKKFFLYGPKFIVPLTLGDIASELNLHETTVSRTANGKYVQTEWGIYELRRFFTNSISGSGSAGSRYSQEAVKEIIKEILLEAEHKLSDSEISGLLKERGISLARRTVAKYRSQMDIGSSYTRQLL